MQLFAYTWRAPLAVGLFAHVVGLFAHVVGLFAHVEQLFSDAMCFFTHMSCAIECKQSPFMLRILKDSLHWMTSFIFQRLIALDDIFHLSKTHCIGWHLSSFKDSLHPFMLRIQNSLLQMIPFWYFQIIVWYRWVVCFIVVCFISLYRFRGRLTIHSSTSKDTSCLCKQPYHTWKETYCLCKMPYHAWKETYCLCKEPYHTWKETYSTRAYFRENLLQFVR